MKIRPHSSENAAKADGLLRQTLGENSPDYKRIQKVRPAFSHEWVCIHRNRVIASAAIKPIESDLDQKVFEIALIAVAPQEQREGFGTELMNFILRRPELKDAGLIVLGPTGFFQHFGFEPDARIESSRKRKKSVFLSQNLCLPTAETTLKVD